MGGRLAISPEELFFIGKQMRAQYIDYDYIKMMGDLQQRYSLKEKEIMAGLVKKGLLMEDFSGRTELVREVGALMRPVFFGRFEIEVILGRPGGSRLREKYHFEDGNSTWSASEGDRLIFSGGAGERLAELKAGILTEDYVGKRCETEAARLAAEEAEQFLIIKNMKPGSWSKGRQLLRVGGTWYVGGEDKKAAGLDRKALECLWENLTKEEP